MIPHTSHGRFAALAIAVFTLTVPSVPASAQSATGFFGVAGVASDSGGTGLNGLTISVRNEATGRTETTTTPSQTGSSQGFFFVALTDFTGNRAAQSGDTLKITVRNDSGEVSSSPSTLTVTDGDITASLRRVDLTVDTGTPVDNTPPGVALSYAQTGNTADPISSAVNKDQELTITATFTEAIADTSTVSISIQPPTTGNPDTGTMTRGSPTSYTFAFTPDTEGTHTITISGAQDASGNGNTAATNNTFRVGPSITAPVVAIGSGAGKAGESVTVPVVLTNAGTEDVGATQFTVTFPDNDLQFTSAASGDAAVASGYQASANEATTGTLNVVVFGLTDQPLGDGVIAEITFTVRSGATEGDAALVGGGLVISSTQATTVAGTQISNGSIAIGAGSSVAGSDVNGDGQVNVLDLQTVVNAILGGQNTADANGDGQTNVLDLQTVVNAILGGG